jgi:hypothetical protein
MQRHLTPLLRELNELRIPVMLLKGFDLLLTTYPVGLPRMMDDVDVLVRPPDIEAAVKILENAGFVQGEIDARNLRLIAMATPNNTVPLATQYEIPPFLKFIAAPELRPYASAVDSMPTHHGVTTLAGDVYVVVECDLHFNVLPDIEVRDVWYNPRRYKTPGGPEVLAQNVSDLLWLLCVRGYNRMSSQQPTAIRSFIDVLCVVARHHDALSWPRIIALTDKYEVHPALYYLLWHVDEILDKAVPASVLESLNPAARKGCREGDVGDFVPKLFRTVHVVPLISR